MTLKVNRQVNSWRARLNLPYFSLSSHLKFKVKPAVSCISDFEGAVAQAAARAVAV